MVFGLSHGRAEPVAMATSSFEDRKGGQCHLSGGVGLGKAETTATCHLEAPLLILFDSQR